MKKSPSLSASAAKGEKMKKKGIKKKGQRLTSENVIYRQNRNGVKREKKMKRKRTEKEREKEKETETKRKRQREKRKKRERKEIETRK